MSRPSDDVHAIPDEDKTGPTNGVWELRIIGEDSCTVCSSERDANDSADICVTYGPDRERNACLIAEAGTVYGDVGLWPRELLNAARRRGASLDQLRKEIEEIAQACEERAHPGSSLLLSELHVKDLTEIAAKIHLALSHIGFFLPRRSESEPQSVTTSPDENRADKP